MLRMRSEQNAQFVCWSTCRDGLWQNSRCSFSLTNRRRFFYWKTTARQVVKRDFWDDWPKSYLRNFYAFRAEYFGLNVISLLPYCFGKGIPLFKMKFGTGGSSKLFIPTNLHRPHLWFETFSSLQMYNVFSQRKKRLMFKFFLIAYQDSKRNCK